MGGLVGPAVGGLLADMVGLRAPFTLTGVTHCLAALYGFIQLLIQHVWGFKLYPSGYSYSGVFYMPTCDHKDKYRCCALLAALSILGLNLFTGHAISL